MDQEAFYLFAVGACVVAGFVRGFAGFGGPAVFLLITTQFFDAARMVIMIMLVDFVASAWLSAASYRAANWRIVRPVTIGALLLLPVGVYLLGALETDVLKRFIAVAVAISTLLLAAGWRMQRMVSQMTLGMVGALTGVIAGATYILIHTIAFLLALPVSAAQTRASFIVISFFIAVPLIVMHLVLQNLSWQAVLSALVLGLVYTGMAWVGDTTFRRTGEERYRRLVLWLLIAMALVVAVR